MKNTNYIVIKQNQKYWQVILLTLFSYHLCYNLFEYLEWGGQLEVRALACALNKKILIYDAQAPVLTISNNEDNNDNDVIRLTYHRHYFSLGEHYNSVVNINEDDNQHFIKN